MITIEYINTVSGRLDTMYVSVDVLEAVLSVMIQQGIVIQSIKN